MASSEVGTCTKGMPRMYVAATKPARSPTTPPPSAMMAESRPKPASRSSSVRRDQLLRVLLSSPAGTVSSGGVRRRAGRGDARGVERGDRVVAEDGETPVRERGAEFVAAAVEEAGTDDDAGAVQREGRQPAVVTHRVSRDGAGSPRHFAGARAAVGDAGEDEEEIGEPVEVDDHDLRHLVRALQADDRPLGAAADRARDVQGGGLRGAAGEDERLERLEFLLAVVDRLLELRDPLVGEARLLELLAVLRGLRAWRAARRWRRGRAAPARGLRRRAASSPRRAPRRSPR